MRLFVALTAALAVLFGRPMDAQSRVTRAPFGRLPDGRAVEQFTLTNPHGIEVRAMTYGAIITAILTPDRNGQRADVALGFDSLTGYLTGSPYFGALVGRYANRIANGRFTLDGTTHELARNNGPNSLHGGKRGWDKYVWSAEPSRSAEGISVLFRHTSPNGDEGYPGAVHASVRYTLTDSNELRLDYTATTDRATPINLTNHSYFNLATNGEIRYHVAEFAADSYTPVDSTLIPTGAIHPVAGTPLDFRKPKPIGKNIDDIPADIGGYDHNFVIRKGRVEPALFARITDPDSGRVLEAYTTEPGFQFYTGNFLDGSIIGKGGITYNKHDAFCLEAQHYPDSINHPGFPSCVLRPGQTYRQTTIYRFSTTK